MLATILIQTISLIGSMTQSLSVKSYPTLTKHANFKAKADSHIATFQFQGT